MDRQAGRTLETFVANRRAPRPGKIKAPSKVVNVVLLGLLRSDPAPASVAREPGGNGRPQPQRVSSRSPGNPASIETPLIPLGSPIALVIRDSYLVIAVFWGRNVAIEQYKWPFDEFF